MKYLNREISELHDLALMQAVMDLNEALAKREQASKHPKFDKNNSKNVGSFPPPNPAFVELKAALEAEMNNRKLKLEE
jgi:hypothetical protein